MKWVSGLVVCLAYLTSPTIDASERDNVLAAMDAEMQRSKDTLKIENYDAPYFISYRIVEVSKTQFYASFGGLVTDSFSQKRRAAVDVRVGDYQFDSSPDQDELGGYEYESFVPHEGVAISGDIPSLRSTLWLLTDEAYKEALSTFLQKKAKRVRKLEKVQVNSLSKEEVITVIEPEIHPVLDREQARSLVVDISRIFRKGRGYLMGDVGFGLRHVRTYLVNSEGTRVVKEHAIYQLSIEVAARAEDGLFLEQGRSMYGRTFEELPSRTQLEDIAIDVMAKLDALRVAPVAEPYTGPAILRPQAAGVFFHETIGHRLEGERQNSDLEGQTFKGQLGQKILPEFISVYDDPTQKKHGTVSLNGHYHVDDEGVKARKVGLVESGVLKTFLTSRTPLETVTQSNGHGRAAGTQRPMARMGNLLVKGHAPTDETTLKSKLIAEAKKQGKPYGLIIDDITGGSTNTSNFGYQAFKGTPRMVYRVDAETGEETLVRGVEMVGTPLSAVNKIIATGREVEVFNGYCGAESGYVPVSAVAPSVLFSEIELQSTKREKRRRPILPAPWRE